ncbi:uncharacterized protein THITE_2113201 [Thermothielavioides terrestris NRRL 8126]|uniref:Uncharacterized protein n=1 Tax=Thermothielavioides terrestris (strain ATCC 38088 / NRRL 8126) TaxID=578455 RepID=G2R203_THETT|nr:uncharacterized protein THITE_2113201 [Thermothielavioides terrestris NRRL 8126]AEO65784.1 hypothetical protein THITE_2113201 [Thermothielavioides terrestris NRRL 8126]
MERDQTESAGPSADSRIAQTNTRFTSPLVISSASRRRSLFSRPGAKAANIDAARPESSPALASDTKVASPSNTRIPRPAQRRPFTLSDAYRLAEKEEEGAAQGSPSPAPRLWRSRREPAEKRTTKTGSTVAFLSRYRGKLDGQPPGPVDGADDRRLPSQQSDSSDSTFDEKLRQYALDEPDRASSPDTALPRPQTPNKSFAWQADADFTASDLQVSNSPPVAIKRSNTKIDEIRALEAEVNDRFSRSPQPRPRSTLADKLRAPDSEAGPKVSDERLKSNDARSSPLVATAEVEGRESRTSTEALRFREVEAVSRRAPATTRPDGFGETLEISGSPSPDIAQRLNRQPRRSFSPLGDRLRRQGSDGLATAVQQQEAPVRDSILAPALRTQDQAQGSTENASCNREADESPGSHRNTLRSTDEPRDVLRRLAVAASGSPAPEAQATTSNQASTGARQRDVGEDGRQKRSNGDAKGEPRPTVGFVGLRRSSSVESRLAKRTSFAHSDSDPTERIEGEMKLFAPLENQSERGSLRAPSPEPDDEVAEETPKPSKLDPLMQPTPRVTGAFVETPATVKSEKPGGLLPDPAAGKGGVYQGGSEGGHLTTGGGADSAALPARDKTYSAVPPQHKRTQSAGGDRAPGRPLSLSARRRARSLSRGRRPLINSVRPPTVKDDLLEIQRANQVDDSTLDDIADLLRHQNSPSASSDSLGPKSGSTRTDKLEGELEAYGRMSRSLETGLLGIRTAKQGIERLEGKVAHADLKEHAPHNGHHDKTLTAPSSCPACRGSESRRGAAVAYIHLPLPRLWSRDPEFRFTFLGLGLFLVSLWYIAEALMCFRYCKPDYCYPGTSCDWSSDDPVWGYALPVKLDQWVTGGQCRDLTRRLGPELADWLADMWDAARGIDISAVDTSRYGWEQKRRHRRRMNKKKPTTPLVERPEDKRTFSAHKSAREAKERAQMADEMGYYELDEDESIASDERL